MHGLHMVLGLLTPAALRFLNRRRQHDTFCATEFKLERSFLLSVTMASVSQPLPDWDFVNIHQRYTACQEPSDSGSAGVNAGLSKPAPYRALPACSAEFIDFDRQVSRQATYSSKNFPFGGRPLSYVAVEMGHVPI